MAADLTPDNLAKDLADLRRRVRALETSAQLPWSSLEDGRVAVTESVDGDERVVLGRFRDPDPTTGDYTGPFVEPPVYGLAILGPNGNTVLSFVDTDKTLLRDQNNTDVLAVRQNATGLIRPEWASQWIRRADGDRVTVTSSTMQTIWSAHHGMLYHDQVEAKISVATDASTTGEIQVREVVSGAVTSVRSVPAGANAIHTLRWAHGAPIGNGQREFVLEARRASGSGTFTVAPLTALQLRSSSLWGAAAAGGWV